MTRAGRTYRLVIIACAAFLVLTVAAMLLYPGGRVGDPGSEGYAFFSNFFSDLGQTHTYGGVSNGPSLVLFCLGLAAVAFGMTGFFITFTGQFAAAKPLARTFSLLGAAAGCVSAASFLGVAATPWNLFLQAHNFFVMWAFRAFLCAVLCEIVAVCATRDVPRRFAWIFALFAVVLAAYIALLAAGPRADTATGAFIQATGQKVIVYASMLTIFVQSVLAARLERARAVT